MKRVHAAGFTLIELVVVLAAILTISLALTPVAVGFVNDSRVLRTRHDTQAIFVAIIRFSFDNGFFPQWSHVQNGGRGTAAGRVDLLVSAGNVPTVAADNLWTTGRSDQLENQLFSNAPGYSVRTATAFGWSGPYLSTAIIPDSWNNRYMVNIGLIDPGSGSETTEGVTRRAVWVISAGPNGRIETLPVQAMTTAEIGGDDIGVRVQ